MYPQLTARSVEPTESDLDAERRRRLRDLALAYRVSAALRWGDLADGHISARDPEQTDSFWLLRYGVGFESATVADMVLVRPDGSVDGGADINRAAYNIHHPIHVARPDAVSAVHHHTQFGTPFSAQGRLLEMITQEATFFFENHALFDDEEVQVRSTEGGCRIAAALGDTCAVILLSHGLLTVGASVAEATARFVTMERVAEAMIKSPNARPISADAARLARDDMSGPGAWWHMFQYLLRRHVPDPTVVD